jgi:curved DNA-binding protein CbpA
LDERKEPRTSVATIMPTMAFEPAASFAGKRTGSVFKMGELGLGYYRDSPPDQPSVFRDMQRARLGPAEPEDEPLTAENATQCHYDLLGVARDASDSDLRAAYRAQALKWHPDKNPTQGEHATETFQRIRAAYALLSDPNERAWYDLHRDQILRGSVPLSGNATAATTPLEAEEPAIELWPYFSSDFSSTTCGGSSFFAVYAALFDELAAEEELMRRLRTGGGRGGGQDNGSGAGGGDETRPLPRFGGASSPWDEVSAFYDGWGTFSTARTGASADKYDLARATKQRRKAQERENQALRAEARRARTECVRALVSYVRKRDPRVVAHEAEVARERAAAPSKKHLERMRLLKAEIRQLEEEEMESDEEEASEAELLEGEEEWEEAEGHAVETVQVEASLKEAAVAVPTDAGKGEAKEGSEDVGSDEDGSDDDDEDAFLRLAAGRAAARPKPEVVKASTDDDDDDDDDDGSDDDDDEDDFLRLAAGRAAARPKPQIAGQIVEVNGEGSAVEMARGGAVVGEAAAEGPPSGSVPTNGSVDGAFMDEPAPATGLVVQVTRHSSVVAHKGRQRDPEAVAAAAAAAAGVRAKRLEDGLGCRCCTFVAHNRKELLKHVQKMGHFSVRRDLPDGLVYEAPQPMRDPLAEKVERKRQTAAIARGRAAADRAREG